MSLRMSWTLILFLRTFFVLTLHATVQLLVSNSHRCPLIMIMAMAPARVRKHAGSTPVRSMRTRASSHGHREMSTAAYMLEGRRIPGVLCAQLARLCEINGIS